MSDRFSAIDPEKQMRIINAAYKEFARQGYKKASTNRIVEAAGIGKGMLFYYFGSKLELYHFLLEYAVTFFDQYFGRLRDGPIASDYIEQYKIASTMKLEAYLKNPYIFEFYTRLFYNPEDLKVSSDAKKYYDEILTLYSEVMSIMHTNSNMSNFRTDMDAHKVIRYVNWCLEGYSQELINKFRLEGQNLSDMDLTPYWDEYYEVLDDLKNIFYQSED